MATATATATVTTTMTTTAPPSNNNTNDSIIRNSIWSVTVEKERDDSFVGISFTGDGTLSSPVLIGAIRPDGPVAQALNNNITNEMCVGMQIVSINDLMVGFHGIQQQALQQQQVQQPLQGEFGTGLVGFETTVPTSSASVSSVSPQLRSLSSGIGGGYPAEILAQMVRSARGGEQLTIVVQGIVAKATTVSTTVSTSSSSSPPPPGRVGISLYKNVRMNAIVVGRIAPTSMFANSGLKVGHRITRINDHICPSTTRETVDLIMECLNNNSPLTFVAIDMPVLRDSEIEESELSSQHNNSMDQSSIASSSVTSDVVSPSSSETPTLQDASPALPQTTTTPLPQTTNSTTTTLFPKFGTITIRAVKPTPTSSVGIGLQKDRITGHIYVNSIATTTTTTNTSSSTSTNSSIFHDTPLQCGHVIVKINGKPCPKSTRDAVKMIKKIERVLYLEVLLIPELVQRVVAAATSKNNTTTPMTTMMQQQQQASTHEEEKNEQQQQQQQEEEEETNEQQQQQDDDDVENYNEQHEEIEEDREGTTTTTTTTCTAATTTTTTTTTTPTTTATATDNNDNNNNNNNNDNEQNHE